MPSNGFVKLHRQGGLELLENDPKAILLLLQVALRANRETGEAYIGDYKKLGFSESQYRATKKRLANSGLATFKGTNKGTVASLVDKGVFDINMEKITDKPTGKRQASDGQTATNNKAKKEEKRNNKTQFDEFWEEYPRREGKKKAKEAFDKIDFNEHSFDDIMDGVRRYKDSNTVYRGFVKLPTTWINGEEWESDFEPMPTHDENGFATKTPELTPAQVEEVSAMFKREREEPGYKPIPPQLSITERFLKQKAEGKW